MIDIGTPGTPVQLARALAPRVAVAAAALTLFAACERDATVVDPDAASMSRNGPHQNTFYGAAVKMGEGVARSYYTMANGVVQEVGVALSENAMQGLPGSETHHRHGGRHRHDNEYVLTMHPQNPTPFQHMAVNWMPQGHPPVYQVPHFDFHFYTISQAERSAIDPSDPQWIQKARNLPAPGMIPQNYVSTHVLAGLEPEDETVPRMGLHWIDVTSPELPPTLAPFTATYIYGSYDGRFIFGEPMVALSFLESKPNFRKELPRAEQGYNAGSYRVYWNQATREYRIALADLPAQN